MMSPASERVIGVDFGTVRVGLAFADLEVGIATPLATYERKDAKHDAEYFTELARTERIKRWIVGLPVHLSGEESQKSYQAREFGDWLARMTRLPVEYFDERFTTVQAHETLLTTGMTARKRRKKLDMLAAQAMLQAYLDSTDRRGPTRPLG